MKSTLRMKNEYKSLVEKICFGLIYVDVWRLEENRRRPGHESMISILCFVVAGDF